jgi:hypothetical protein
LKNVGKNSWSKLNESSKKKIMLRFIFNNFIQSILFPLLGLPSSTFEKGQPNSTPPILAGFHPARATKTKATEDHLSKWMHFTK